MKAYETEKNIITQQEELCDIFRRISPEQREDFLKIARLADIFAKKQEKDELVCIFAKLPQYLQEKVLDLARMSEIVAETQKQQTA